MCQAAIKFKRCNVFISLFRTRFFDGDIRSPNVNLLTLDIMYNGSMQRYNRISYFGLDCPTKRSSKGWGDP